MIISIITQKVVSMLLNVVKLEVKNDKVVSTFLRFFILTLK